MTHPEDPDADVSDVAAVLSEAASVLALISGGNDLAEAARRLVCEDEVKAKELTEESGPEQYRELRDRLSSSIAVVGSLTDDDELPAWAVFRLLGIAKAEVDLRVERLTAAV